MTRRAGRALLIALPLAFLVVFFLYPLATIVSVGLQPEGRLDTSAVGRLMTDPSLRRVIAFTFAQAVASTALTLAIGLPVAYLLSRFRFRGRALVRALVVIPFVLPTVVVANAFIALPVAGLDRSIGAILAAHVFLNVAVVVLVVGAALAHVDPAMEDAAAVLGAGRVRAVLETTLPIVRSSVVTAAAIVFLFTFSSFGVVLLLGGPGRSTVEVEIYRQTAQLLNLPVAAALSLLQLAVAGTLAWAIARQERRAARRAHVPQAFAARQPETPGERAFTTGTLAVLLALVLAPLLALVQRSVTSEAGVTLDRFVHLGSVRAGGVFEISPIRAMATSLLFAAAAAALALALGGSAAATASGERISRKVRALAMLPLGVSAVAIGFGYVVAFDAPPLDLRGSLLLVPLAQAVVGTPFVVRVLVPALREVDERPREAAAVLGATPARVRREVVLPMVWRPALVAATLAFAVALGEFGATAFLARLDNPTVPVAIARLLDRPGSASIGQADAMSVLLMLVTAVAVLAIDRIRPHAFGRL